MSYRCDVCGKGKVNGGRITRRGLPKKQGGIGTHIVKNTKRTYKPNLQKVKVQTEQGTKRIKACTSCIKRGKIQKAVR